MAEEEREKIFNKVSSLCPRQKRAEIYEKITYVEQRKYSVSDMRKMYKKFITEDQNSTLRSKIEQLRVDGKKCFIERKFRKEKKEEKRGDGDGGGRDCPTLTTSELLDTLPRSKTTLVSAPSGQGKSTLAAIITERWAKSEQSTNQHQLILFTQNFTQTTNGHTMRTHKTNSYNTQNHLQNSQNTA